MNTATLERRPSSQKTSSYIKWFREIGITDVSIVGGKTASLGEMFRELIPKGIKVPDGFAITVADFVDIPEKRPTLGDAYRIEARIVSFRG